MNNMEQEITKIRFKDLTLPLKIAVISGWIFLVLGLIEFGIGYIIGALGIY